MAVSPTRFPDPVHLSFERKTQLMNEIVMKRAQCDEIPRFIASSAVDRNNVMRVKPAIIGATMARQIYECASGSVANIYVMPEPRGDGRSPFVLCGFCANRVLCRNLRCNSGWRD